MNILVFNCGSSSLNFKVYGFGKRTGLDELLVGKAHRVGVKGDRPSFIEYRCRGEKTVLEVPLKDHRVAAKYIIEAVEKNGIPVDRIGHRWANGLDRFSTAEVKPELLPILRSLVPQIPLHHSIALAVIRECAGSFPEITQYVTTDNAFHRNLPFRASRYVLPRDVAEKFGFRRIGFHGLSFRFIAERAPKMLNLPAEDLRMVVCHLGTGGSEIAAVNGGSSVDASMGYTGLPGIVMSTRCGDVDPLLPLYLMRAFGYNVDDVQSVLHDKSGLLGVSGESSDIRDLLERSRRNDETARLAVSMYVRAVKKYVGAFIVALQGIDCLVFTDDVGIWCSEIRDLVCSGLGWFGIELDGEKNGRQIPASGAFLEGNGSRVKVLALPTDEERIIAEEGVRLYGDAIA